MEWVERLNRSINYIEEHLTGEIDYEQLGRIACCSAYHYQRMFTYMAGITLSEYIRRRKMSLAAVDLQGGNERILDIAEKYGYRSPTAFNRAFQSFHGMAPSSVKGEGVSVKTFSPIVFRIAVKGATEMDYRIETKEAFRIVGVSAPLDKEIKKASVCKRLVNPDECNPKCVKGYTFALDGEQYQKCRYMAFQPALSEENNPYIKQFLEKELWAADQTK